MIREQAMIALFTTNLHEKSGREDFRKDMDALLRHDLSWDFDDAMHIVLGPPFSWPGQTPL